MTAAWKSLAPIRGDAYLEATMGDCASVAVLLNRTNGMRDAVMSVPGGFAVNTVFRRAISSPTPGTTRKKKPGKFVIEVRVVKSWPP